MPSTLKKVTKSLSKSSSPLHVKGRKFQKIESAMARDRKLTAQKARSKEQKDLSLAVYKAFKQHIQHEKQLVYSIEDMKKFIEEYLSQFEQEKDQVILEKRPGRSLTSKAQLLVERAKSEQQKYKTGYKVPDLRDDVTVMRLRQWNETTGGVSSMKVLYLTRDTDDI